MGHGWSKNERGFLALDAKLRLVIPKEVTEIDVEKVSVLFEHDVIVVAVTDAKGVSPNAVTSARR